MALGQINLASKKRGRKGGPSLRPLVFVDIDGKLPNDCTCYPVPVL